ncbi:hypothetical protein BaRGS_00020340, partial [Batillaria attramentaria]
PHHQQKSSRSITRCQQGLIVYCWGQISVRMDFPLDWASHTFLYNECTSPTCVSLAL